MLTGHRTLSARNSGLLPTRSSGAEWRRTAAQSSGDWASIAAEGIGVPTAFCSTICRPSGTPSAKHAIAAIAIAGAVASHRDRPAAAKAVSTRIPGRTPRQPRSLLAMVLTKSQATPKLAPQSRANPATKRLSARGIPPPASAPMMAVAPAK